MRNVDENIATLTYADAHSTASILQPRRKHGNHLFLLVEKCCIMWIHISARVVCACPATLHNATIILSQHIVAGYCMLPHTSLSNQRERMRKTSGVVRSSHECDVLTLVKPLRCSCSCATRQLHRNYRKIRQIDDHRADNDLLRSVLDRLSSGTQVGYCETTPVVQIASVGSWEQAKASIYRELLAVFKLDTLYGSINGKS
jgi:hypothetical protein